MACSGNCIFIECDSPWTSILIDSIYTYNNVDNVTLSTITLPENTSVHITSRIEAVRRAGPAGVPGETWQYTVITRAKNIAGVVTVSAPLITSFLDTAEPILTYIPGVNSVVVNLVGAANKTIFWVAKHELIKVSYAS